MSLFNTIIPTLNRPLARRSPTAAISGCPRWPSPPWPWWGC